MKVWSVEANAALRRLNATRSQFGGSTFTMGQIKSFKGFTGNAKHRTEEIERWSRVYSEWGPKMAAIDMDLNEADKVFLAAKVPSGPDSWHQFWTVEYAKEVAALQDEGLLPSPSEV